MHSATKLNSSSFFTVFCAHTAGSKGEVHSVHPGDGTQVSTHGDLHLLPLGRLTAQQFILTASVGLIFRNGSNKFSFCVSPLDCPIVFDSGLGCEVFTQSVEQLWGRGIARLGLAA